ncbi:hypothetical protein C8J56DRAFT_911093 [Mycena floridula]|nr:hypothetical protein C8J56DRAFT_911093 [Mycena floridula]
MPMADSSSSACRILVISPSLDLISDLISKIKAIPSKTPQNDPNPIVPIENGTSIPWTISNKYYTASVHFSAHTIKGLAPHVLKDVPAVVFVWAQGQAFKHHILRIGQDMNGAEPEVSLAVMLSGSASAEADDDQSGPEDDEDSNDIDEFLSSHGFEFIDATSGQDRIGLSESIPSLPRVLDALSTIMWPSMQGASSSSQPTHDRHRAFLDWAESPSGSFDISEEDLVVTPPQGSGRGPAEHLRMQKQMAELARWLEEDDDEQRRRDMKEDPWQSEASGDVISSPTELSVNEDQMKFEDDFTVFVSAPATSLSNEHGHLTPTHSAGSFNPSFDFDGLGVPLSGSLYRSLGSQSDLGDIDHDGEGGEHIDSDDDDLLPTKEEIQSTASRLFGSHDDADDDLAAFDLSRVLGALQGIKEEIATMEDEGERRKAAAKASLALLVGLERDPVSENAK